MNNLEEGDLVRVLECSRLDLLGKVLAYLGGTEFHYHLKLDEQWVAIVLKHTTKLEKVFSL